MNECIHGCGHAWMWACKDVGMHGCGHARVWACMDVGTQGCATGGVNTWINEQCAAVLIELIKVPWRTGCCSCQGFFADCCVPYTWMRQPIHHRHQSPQPCTMTTTHLPCISMGTYTKCLDVGMQLFCENEFPWVLKIQSLSQCLLSCPYLLRRNNCLFFLFFGFLLLFSRFD